jgi:hypothetical protein
VEESRVFEQIRDNKPEYEKKIENAIEKLISMKASTNKNLINIFKLDKDGGQDIEQAILKASILCKFLFIP